MKLFILYRYLSGGKNIKKKGLGLILSLLFLRVLK